MLTILFRTKKNVQICKCDVKQTTFKNVQRAKCNFGNVQENVQMSKMANFGETKI
jgi:hypothetical protein